MRCKLCANRLDGLGLCGNYRCESYGYRNVADGDIKVEVLLPGEITCMGCGGKRTLNQSFCPNHDCSYCLANYVAYAPPVSPHMAKVHKCVDCGQLKPINEYCNNPTCVSSQIAYGKEYFNMTTQRTVMTNADPDHPRDGFVRVGNGSKFYLYNPSRSKGIRLIDLIMPIAEIARYNFHLPVHYSVAEHCIYASRFCSNPLYALLHDLAETIIGDLPAPVKAMCPDYKRVELRVEKWVYDVFGLKDIPVPSDLKTVDKRLLNTEQLHFGRSADLVETYPPYGDLRIGCWKPTYAVLKYYERLQELTNGRYTLESILEMPEQPDEYFGPSTGTVTNG